jgi:dephospho-CoA kinase
LKSTAIVHPKYIDRAEIIYSVADAFHNNRVVYLCGIRGSGKTEIVQKYISENKFYGVITLYHGDNLKKVLEDENPFESKNASDDKICKAFSIMDSHYLLVIENVTSKLTEEWTTFIDQCGCKVLILSSWRPRGDRLTIVDVNKLTEQQAIEMMDKWIVPSVRLEQWQKAAIAKKVNYHALAVTLYAKAIDQSCLEFNEILSILNKSVVSDELEEIVALEQEEAYACEHIRNLFMVTIKDDLTDDDKSVLRVMSLVPASGITLRQLQKYAGLKNNNPVNCTLKPLFWVEIRDDVERTIAIHSIIRDIVLTELKPDMNNCQVLVDAIYDEIDKYWGYSNAGVVYRKLYFSILTKLTCVPAEDNCKRFDLYVKGISSLSNYGYTDEAKLLYDKVAAFVETLNASEQDDYNFVLSCFNLHWQNYSNADEYLDKNIALYTEILERIRSILLNENLNLIEKKIACFPYIDNYVVFLNKYLDLIPSKEENIQKAESESFFIKIYIIMSKLYPDFVMPLTNANGELQLSCYIPEDRFYEYRVIMHHLVYARLFYLTAHSEEPLIHLAFENIDYIFKKFYGEVSFHYIKFLYIHYCACKRFANVWKSNGLTEDMDAKMNSISNKIKKLYHAVDFANYNFTCISEIVQEFNLPHSGITSLEEE